MPIFPKDLLAMLNVCRHFFCWGWISAHTFSSYFTCVSLTWLTTSWIECTTRTLLIGSHWPNPWHIMRHRIEEKLPLEKKNDKGYVELWALQSYKQVKKTTKKKTTKKTPIPCRVHCEGSETLPRRSCYVHTAIKVGSLPECSSFSPYTPYTTPSGKWITTTALNYLCSST